MIDIYIEGLIPIVIESLIVEKKQYCLRSIRYIIHLFTIRKIILKLRSEPQRTSLP
jgi:hypothetical protein